MNADSHWAIGFAHTPLTRSTAGARWMARTTPIASGRGRGATPGAGSAAHYDTTLVLVRSLLSSTTAILARFPAALLIYETASRSC